jgi:hypothetical protein
MFKETRTKPLARFCAIAWRLQLFNPRSEKMGWKRQMCLTVGSLIPESILRESVAITEALEMGHWLHTSGFGSRALAATRDDLFRQVARDVSNCNVLYMEFGVWQGASVRIWSELLKNPASNLHGFDSFEGLPEDWIDGFTKGHFSTNGKVPSIPDPRVKFFKGWFEKTLPAYELPPHEVLLVSIDCDLYQPAHYVLDFLAPHFRSGDYLYFDEFHLPQHEVRAFREFTHSNRNLAFSLAGATSGFSSAVFKCTGK